MHAAAVIVAAVASNGCVYTHALGPQSYATLNRIAERAPAEVTLRSGASGTALSLRVRPDSTTWREPVLPERHTTATANLLRVEFRRRAQGAGEGLFVGAAAGAALGAALGAMTNPRPVDSGFHFGRGFYVIAGSTIIGVVGGLVGTGAGASRGSRDVFLAPAAGE